MEPEIVLQDILDMAQKVSVEANRIKNIFEKSGIPVSDDMKIGDTKGNGMILLKNLMNNLTEMAVVKISAKQVIRKSGLSF